MSLTPLGPGAEFDIVRRILEGAAPPQSRVKLGAGDDCALIAAGDIYLAVSVDLSREGTHFLGDWGTPELFGERAVRAAVSDLAAMAADPLALLVALSVPAGAGAELTEAVGRGCRVAAETLGAALVGGDISRGGNELVIDVVAIGEVASPTLRSGVRPGDELWVTGRLGAAAAAVTAWRTGRSPRQEWRDRFWRPEPRLREARFLMEHGAVAAIDLSDGLVADAGHLSAASGVAVELDWEATPLAEGVDAELALTGGEDFELLVAFAGGILTAELSSEFESVFGIPLTRVGRAASGIGVRVFRNGAEVGLVAGGYDHFRRGSG